MSSDEFDPAASESALLPSELHDLSAARRLMANNRPAQAAPTFARLAELLTSAGQPQRGANLHADAAQAFAESHNEAPALLQARAALKLFLKYKMDERAAVFYTKITQTLTQHALPGAAATLEKEFGSRLVKTAPAAAAVAARLPANCPQCGAPVHLSDMQAGTLECPFCGTPIRPVA